MRRAQLLITPSGSLARDLNPSRNRTLVVPNGVDLDKFAPPTDEDRSDARKRFGLKDEVVVGFLGGYATDRKGLHHLLGAIAEGPAQERLIVAGPGPEQILRSQIRQLGLAGRVIVAGEVDPMDVYACADVIAVPSLYEPFSLVALEAAACSLPVVISARAGANEVLSDVMRVVDDIENPKSLREALDALEDPQVGRALGKSARERAEQMSWSAVMGAAVDALETLARSTGSDSPLGDSRHGEI